MTVALWDSGLARQRWGELLDSAADGSQEIVITRRGKPTAALINYEDFLALQAEHPVTHALILDDLGDPAYRLEQPLAILIEEYIDTLIARSPELGVFGEGSTTAAAIANLKAAILDLYDELTTVNPTTLGSHPHSLLRLLHQTVTRIEL